MKKADQFQKQLYRAEEDRRQALATSEALTSLWQKKFDKAQNENYDLRWSLKRMVFICILCVSVCVGVVSCRVLSIVVMVRGGWDILSSRLLVLPENIESSI